MSVNDDLSAFRLGLFVASFSGPAGAGNLLGGTPPPPDDNGRGTLRLRESPKHPPGAFCLFWNKRPRVKLSMCSGDPRCTCCPSEL